MFLLLLYSIRRERFQEWNPKHRDLRLGSGPLGDSLLVVGVVAVTEKKLNSVQLTLNRIRFFLPKRTDKKINKS